MIFPVRLQLLATEILQTRVAFLPFGFKLLKSLKSRPWVLLPKTLGQHLRKRRMELGLKQRELRKRFSLERETYANWEKDRCYPAMRHWPKIIEFLGYEPTPEPKSIGEQLIAYRRRYGLSRKALARRIGANEASLWRWETARRVPERQKHIDSIRRLGVT